MWAAIDNTVFLPGYTRADGAVFYFISEKVRLQANEQDLLHQRRRQQQHHAGLLAGSPCWFDSEILTEAIRYVRFLLLSADVLGIATIPTNGFMATLDLSRSAS